MWRVSIPGLGLPGEKLKILHCVLNSSSLLSPFNLTSITVDTTTNECFLLTARESEVLHWLNELQQDQNKSGDKLNI